MQKQTTDTTAGLNPEWTRTQDSDMNKDWKWLEMLPLFSLRHTNREMWCQIEQLKELWCRPLLECSLFFSRLYTPLFLSLSHSFFCFPPSFSQQAGAQGRMNQCAKKFKKVPKQVFWLSIITIHNFIQKLNKYVYIYTFHADTTCICLQKDIQISKCLKCS